MYRTQSKKFNICNLSKNWLLVIHSTINLMCIKGDIKPSNVQMKPIPNGQTQITCTTPKNMYLFHKKTCTIKIGRRRLHSGLEWEVIKEFNNSEDMSYSVSSDEANRYDYAVCYCVDDRSSDWVPAERLNLDQPHGETKFVIIHT